MARDISIAISARDNFSQAITTMKNANNAFNKDLTGLQGKLDQLNKTRINLKVDTTKARTDLRDAEKQFLATGSAADKLKMELANADYENARRNLDLVAKNARQAEKDIHKLTGAVSKAENRAGTGGGIKSLGSSLAAAGATKLIGDLGANVAMGVASSAFGDLGGDIASGIMSGASSGAAVGAMVGNPLLGGALGAGLGAVQAGIGIYGKQDTAFKQVVQSYFDDAMQSQEETRLRGTDIAGRREMAKISFSTLLGGEAEADSFLADVVKFAEQTPFGYDQLTDISKTLLAYGYQAEELIPLLTKVGDAGSALSMSPEDMNNVATYLGRMQSTGKTTARYLNPLLEKGIPVWDYLAKASGKTKEQVQEMVSKGLVPGEEAAKAIADYMGSDFAGNMEKQTKTYEGMVSILGDVQESMDAAMGDGYNEERKKGIQAQIDYFDSEYGEKMKEANKMIGEWRASLENDRDRAIQEEMTKMFEDNDEYQQALAEGNRVKMGELLAEAQIKGENRYKETEGYEAQFESEKSLIKRIQEDTALKDEYWNAGWIMGKEFSKGRLSALAGSNKELGPDTLKNLYPGYSYGPKKAYGMNYVPYDNFPALLHEGERVLTASENRGYSNMPPISISDNIFNVREEADIDKIGQVISNNIIKALGVM